MRFSSKNPISPIKDINPLSARIFTVFVQFIRGQSVTQRSMGCEAPRYPPQYPGP